MKKAPLASHKRRVSGFAASDAREDHHRGRRGADTGGPLQSDHDARIDLEKLDSKVGMRRIGMERRGRQREREAVLRQSAAFAISLRRHAAPATLAPGSTCRSVR